MRSDSLLFKLRGVIALTVIIGFALAFVLTACQRSEPQEEPAATAPQEVVVLGASSVEPALDRLEHELVERNGGPEFLVSYAGTPTLVNQIRQGSEFDVVITASRDHMAELAEEDLINGEPLPIASNRLALVTPADNPAGIEDFEDYISRSDEISTAVCAPEVPCGVLTQNLEDEFDVELEADTEAPSAASVLSQVINEEVDAGLVYVTDVHWAQDEVRGFEIPEHENSTNQIWVAVSTDPVDSESAEQLLSSLASEPGRAAFEDAGFLPAPAAEAENGA